MAPDLSSTTRVRTSPDLEAAAESHPPLALHQFPQPPVPYVRRERDALDHLSTIIHTLREKPGAHKEHRELLGKITGNGSLFRGYAQQLNHALFQVQFHDTQALPQSGASDATIAHLKLCLELVNDDLIDAMHQAERLGWLKMLHNHICYLRLSQEWSDRHSHHLTLTSELAELLLLSGSTPVPKDHYRYDELVHSVGDLLSSRFDSLISDYENPSSLHAAETLVNFSRVLSHRSLLAPLKNCFLSVNRLCTNLNPEEYGGGMADHLDDDEGIETDDEDLDGEITLAESNDLLEADEVEFDAEITQERPSSSQQRNIISEEGLTFEDRMALETDRHLEQLEEIHDGLLHGILITPGHDVRDTFWIDVLRDNSYFMPGWEIALSALPLCSMNVVKELLQDLVQAGTEDGQAVIHLLNLMSNEEIPNQTSDIDMPSLVIDAVANLSRIDQKDFLWQANQIIKHAPEALNNLAVSRQQFSRLRRHLRRNP